MEVTSFFLGLILVLLPSLLLGGISKDFSILLVGFTVGVVAGIQVGVLSSWWITLAVLGLVASIFVKSRGD